jgi:hypothetical protein
MANARFLDDLLHNLKDKQLELKRDEESYGNSPSEDDLEYLVEKYKASFDYFIQDIQAAVDRMPQNNPGNENNNSNPSNPNVNNNPSGGKRKNKNKKTRKHRK